MHIKRTITLKNKNEEKQFSKYRDAAKFLGVTAIKVKAFANVKGLKLNGWIITSEIIEEEKGEYVKERGLDILYYS